MRTTISARITRPTDLCRLNASTRGPTGCLGICCIHQPHANCPMTSSAISQCSAIAVRVYRECVSEAGIDADAEQEIAGRCRLEVSAVDLARQHPSDAV